MARQYILASPLGAIYVNESAARQYILAPGLFVNELVATPFIARADRRNPITKPFPSDLRGFTQGLNLGLRGAVAVASARQGYDWPNPISRPHPISLRTHLNPVPLNLLGKDQFFSVAGQPPTYTWTVPRGRPPQNLYGFWTVNLQNTLLASPAAPPFIPQMWPNPPLVVAEARRGKGWPANLLESTLAPPPPARPFNNREWPNPRARGFPQQILRIPEPYAPPSSIVLLEGGGIFIGDAVADLDAAIGDANLYDLAGLAMLGAAAGVGSAVQSPGVEIKYRVGPLPLDAETLPNANARITENGDYRLTEAGIPRVTQ